VRESLLLQAILIKGQNMRQLSLTHALTNEDQVRPSRTVHQPGHVPAFAYTQPDQVDPFEHQCRINRQNMRQLALTHALTGIDASSMSSTKACASSRLHTPRLNDYSQTSLGQKHAPAFAYTRPYQQIHPEESS